MDKVLDASISDRIRMDFDEVREDIGNILEDFLQFKLDRKIQGSVGPECVESLESWEAAIKKRMGDSFSIVVIGDFKRGKSTLVNALLREQVVTTNVTPETVTINRISFGEKDSVEAVLEDGRRAMLDKNELYREQLEKLIPRFPSPVEYIDIKTPIDSLKGIRIVDTPGVGDLLNRFDNQVKEYLVYADAVIYVVSALSPLSQTEQNFLCASILPQNFSKLFVVLNMMDCLQSTEEVEKVRNLIDMKLANIFPNSFVYAISSLDEYCRVKSLKRPNPDLSGMLEESFSEMYDTLQNDIILNKDIIRTERCLNMTKFMLREIEGRVTLIDNMLQLNQSKLDNLMGQYRDENSVLMKKIDRHKQSLRLDINDMYSEASEWMEEFMKRLEAEINSVQNTPLETLEKHFHFYIIDMIRSAIMECTNEHLKAVSKLLKKSSEAFAGEFSNMNLSTTAHKIASSMLDISWTNYDAAAVILSFVPGLGALTLLGQAVIGFSKQVNTSGQQKKYIGNVLSSYQRIKDSVFTELKNVYKNMSMFAEKQLDIIYENQITASIAAIKQAQEIYMKNDDEKEDIKSGLGSALQIIQAANRRLSKYEEIAR